ncbi:MAG: hydantoinase/oxoprolinase family protein [Rhizobiales bacterium]|nr:hydantoinase/oxoprolinase family protein [Hyphomicrobiales bacterium]
MAHAPKHSQAKAIIGVDTGGTFTDITLLNPATGEVWNAKTPSTPLDPSQGFGNGITEILSTSGLAGSEIARVLHGTTVATNLILEGKGAKAALLTTRGFKYVIEIGRQDVPRRGSLFAWVKPKRPIAPEHIFEIGGRIEPDGNELEALDEAAIRQAAKEIKAAGISAVAVVFLHSYANADHERRAAAIIEEEHPDALVSISSDVLPVFREYERSMTTILNVAVMPVVSAYVERLDQRISERKIEAPLLLMKSSGGVTSARNVKRAPVETALSGPAAGAVGATFVGANAGVKNLIGIDIGGTSADVCLIHDGKPGLTTSGHVGDWPLGLPMVDIVTIGAGGGSIARVSKSGALTVGPESAGAEPGPVCYRRGGEEPTVTDAHLVLGHLPPYLLDGKFALDIEGAQRAVRKYVADPLGMSVEAAARGILSIVDNLMVGAIRIVSVERGHDPRDFALLPFGGAGPLHGGALARLLGMRTMLVPPNPGVLSALGLLVSNLKAEFTRTCLQKARATDLSLIARVFGELEADAVAWLEQEDVPQNARQTNWTASVRYQNQGFELFIPWAAREVTPDALAATIAAFHQTHERLYTFAQEDTPVEIVTLRVDAQGVFPAPAMREIAHGGNTKDAIVAHQKMHLASGTVDGPVYDRARLGSDARIEGPAIVTQLDATTLVLDGQTATTDRFGNLLISEKR